MNQLISVFRIFLAIVVSGLLVACGKDPSLETIEITGGPASISTSLAVGTTTQMSATGIYSDSSHKDLSGEVRWASSNTGVLTVNGAGMVTAVAPGTASVSATLDDVTISTTLVVTPATLVSIEITPATSSVAVGLSVQLVATGVFTDHTTQNLTTQVAWTSATPAVAAFQTPGQPGLLKAVSVGSAVLSVALNGVSASKTLAVRPVTLTTIEITPASPSLAQGASRQLTATGIFSDNTTQNLTSQVDWVSSNAAVATISGAPGAGSLLGVGTGTSTITATLGFVLASTTVTVTPATLVSIQITPPSPSIAFGLKQQFTATGLYTDNSTQDLTPQVTWSSSATAVATISNAAGSNGLASSAGVGSTTITATLGTVSANTTLAVTQAALVSIGVTPATSSIAKGLSRQFTAMGVYTDTTTQNLTNTVTWSSSDTSVATISNAAGSRGLASSVDTGPVTITATLGTVSGAAQLTVTPATLVSIEVTPTTPSTAMGLTLQFAATGIYTDTTTQDLTTVVTWSSSATAVATINNAAGSQGLATPVGTGTTTITATVGAVSSATPLTVTPAELVSIEVTPVTLSIALGLSQQFTAMGIYTDNTTQNLTNTVTWSSSATSVASISNAAGSRGLAATTGIGPANIIATLGTVTGGTLLTVTPATLVSIGVTPGAPSIPKGLAQQFTATGVYTDNSTQNLTTAVTWSSSATGVATISNAAGSQGLASTPGIGSTTVTATLGTVSGAVTLTVTSPTLVSIQVTPANAVIADGLTQQYTATGLYTDNSTQNLTTTVTWASSAPTVAAISNAVGSKGFMTALVPGSTMISATLGSVSGNTALNVTNATLVSIAVTPASPSVAKGQTRQFTATGTYTDASTQNLTTSVTWSSSATAVATISNAAGFNGLASTPGTGTSTITATLGAVSGSTTLTVTAAVLSSIAVTPVSASTAKGLSRAFTATGTYTDLTTQNLTTSVTWASSATSVATISNTTPNRGVASALNVGSTSISATSGSISGSTLFTVTAAVLQSISVTSGASSYANGTSAQFTATGTFSDGSTSNLSSSASWSSGNTNIATISSTGSASFAPPASITAATVGSYFGPGVTLTAAVGSVSGGKTVTMYQSFNAGGTSGIFSRIQNSACPTCHGAGGPYTNWYSTSSSTTYSTLLSRGRLNNAATSSDFYYFICMDSRMSGVWTAQQCGIAKAWANGGYIQN